MANVMQFELLPRPACLTAVLGAQPGVAANDGTEFSAHAWLARIWQLSRPEDVTPCSCMLPSVSAGRVAASLSLPQSLIGGYVIRHFRFINGLLARIRYVMGMGFTKVEWTIREFERLLDRRPDGDARRVNSLVHQIAALPTDKLLEQLRALIIPEAPLEPLEPKLQQRLICALEDASKRLKDLASAIRHETSQ